MFYAGLIFIIAFWCYRKYEERKNPRWICKECGYAGPMKMVTEGSFMIEVILWLCFLSPGLIYSLWRSSTKRRRCPECKSPSLVPTDSPVGSKLFAEQYPSDEQGESSEASR